MSSMSDLFKRMPIDHLVDEQLYNAQRHLLEHEAAAEHHAALADMYRRRISRLMQAGPTRDSAALLHDDTAAIDLKTGKRLRA